jgi:class 3 adenylate cyclase/TolB-like protein/Flp pilus assembly protein TadD
VAILAADVVGYSRLMGADEVGTLRTFKSVQKDITDPIIASHGGRIVKTTGDGLLSEFPSVVDAVACAVTIQRKMLVRNSDVPNERRIVFRIGINVGDIIIEGSDIFGDGVNIAARLESICEPGGLCISDTACDQVRGKLPLTFADGGEQQVKNIARPIRVFTLAPQSIAEAPEMAERGATPAKSRGRIPLVAAAALTVIAIGAGAWWVMRPTTPQPSTAGPQASIEIRPTVAVLPLVSFGADKEDYFADGLTEDIISALGRFSDLVVRSRNAVFAYKNKTPKPDEVGRELDVRYIVEGSVRRSPERIRIAISLTAAPRGTQLWSETYDVAPKDIFSVQDDITRRIAGTLASRLTGLELAKAATKPPNSLEAYDLVLRGRDLLNRVNRTANSQARMLLNQAIAADPNYAPAYVALGRVELNAVLQGWTADPQAALQRGENLARKAIAIEPASAGAHSLLGGIYTRYGDYDRALDEMHRAVELNSSDPNATAGLATALLWSGDIPAAVRTFETAIKLGLDLSANEAFALGVGYLLADRNADAIRTLERSLERSRTDVYTNAVLAAAYAQAGRQDDAERQARTVRTIDPRFDSADFGSLLREAQLREKLSAALNKAGL